MSEPSPLELKNLKEGGKILGKILKRLLRLVVKKKTGDEINAEAERLIKEAGGYPAFKEVRNEKGENYPAALCLSLNEEVVHGLPFSKKIRPGDIVSLDLGLRYKGWVTDMAWTVYVEGKDPKIRKMLRANQLALRRAIQKAHPPFFVEDLSRVIEQTAKRYKVVPVKELSGHGVGKSLHEEPSVLNIFTGRREIPLKQGMILAIEPIFASQPYSDLHSEDGWTIIAPEGVLTSHFEATIIVKAKKAEVITPLP